MRLGQCARTLVVMAQALDIRETEQKLHDLRVEEWSDLALGGLAMGLSLVASHAAPAFTLPLFFGGLVVTILAGRAFFRRWDLCDRLLLDPSAYAIPEVQARAKETAGDESRAILARSIRSLLAQQPPYQPARVQLVEEELATLAEELGDGSLSLDPICAVRCKRLLGDAIASPLLNTDVPADGLRIAITSIRAGFEQKA
jgi:hypothetical protein